MKGFECIKSGKISLLLFLLFSSVAFGQDADSLKEVLKSNKHDTIKLQALTDLNWYYSGSDFGKSKYYAKQEVALAKKIKNQKWIAQGYNDMAISYYWLENYDSALYYNFQALKIREKFKDQRLIASSLSKIGLMYQELGEYLKAIDYHYRVLEIAEKLNDRQTMGHTHNNIAIVYEKLKNFKKAVRHAQKAIEYFDPETEDYFIAKAYGNLAGNYNQLRKYDLSNSYFEKALATFKKYGDKSSEAGAENGLGMNSRLQGKLDNALKHYKRAYELSIEINEKNSKIVYAHNIAIVLKKMKRYAEAEAFLREILKETDEKNTAQKLLMYRQLASLYGYLDKGDSVEAYLNKYADLKEKTFNAKAASELANFETRYNTEKAKRQLAENQVKLESRKRWLLVSVASVGILAIIFAFVYRYQKTKRKSERKELELNKELEKTRLEKEFGDEKIRIARELHDNIGSHLTFMISSLDNLAYIENPEQKLGKVADLSNFGRLTMKDLRDTIWAMNHDGGSFEQLMARVSELRSVLPSNLYVNITSNVHNNKPLNGLQLLNCYRIIQEFIQNTIKYAEAEEIEIYFRDNGSGFVVQLKDNGKGFDTTNINFGNGILNMKRRCEDLNGSFAITSGPGGTSAECAIPY
ncbi:MAG: tetratricopeptide repeat-containing sensor histidine kinase [Bacteroidota bacterium]